MSRGSFSSTVYYSNTSYAALAVYPITAACWFYSTDTSRLQSLIQLISIGSDIVHGLMFDAGVAGDPLKAQSYAGGGGAVASSNGTPINQWVHACAVFSSATSRAVYRDGGNKGTNATSKTGSSMERIYCGNDVYGLSTRYLVGLIAEAAIWNTALTDAEVANLGTKRISPLCIRPEYLVSYYPFIGNNNPEIDIAGGYNLSPTGSPSKNSQLSMFYQRNFRS